ncbi:MAG TPA: hypothetical protein V6C85_12820 [Allocoleopsis sp.]
MDAIALTAELRRLRGRRTNLPASTQAPRGDLNQAGTAAPVMTHGSLEPTMTSKREPYSSEEVY